MTRATFAPHDYQTEAIRFAEDRPACYLALPMGAGKTVVTLTVCDSLVNDYLECRRILVVAPKRVAEMVWTTEAAKWEHLGHLTVARCIGTPKERTAALAERADITVTNRENLAWLVEHLGKRFDFDALVWDEASGLKDRSTIRFKTIKSVRDKFKRVILLSGTPAPNSLLDLWPAIYLLDGGQRLGRTLTAYRDAFFSPDKRNRQIIYSWKIKPGAEQEIHERLSDICLSQELDLGIEEIHNEIAVQLPAKALAQYQQLERDSLLPLAAGDLVGETAATLTMKLVQMAGGCCYDENGDPVEFHQAKFDALDEIIEDSNGQPVLVFYWFKHTLARLKKRYPKLRLFDGEATLRDWQAGKVPLMALHPGSAGHGVEGLQHGGAIAVWMDLTYSLELYLQTNARLARQGQRDTVIIHHLLARDTVDADIYSILQSKAGTQERLLDALKRRAKL